MHILIDNYCSFTYNIIHWYASGGITLQRYFNDAITTDEILALNPTSIVIGPGPGTPADAGISIDLMLKAANLGIPVFGICLGMQAIGEAFGGKVVRAIKPMHGKISPIYHHNCGAFHGLEKGVSMTRYHSLVVERESLPSCLEITAETDQGEIMGLRHKTLPIEGVQFHPEAVASESGLELLFNIKNIGHKK